MKRAATHLLGIVSFSVTAVLPTVALAVASGAPSGAPTSIDALWGAICTVGNWVFAFILAGAVIAFIYSGYLFYSSGGGEKVNQAKKVLTYGLIGTGIAILSKTLIVILGDLVGANVSPFLCN